MDTPYPEIRLPPSTAPAGPPAVSVVILTFNEERNIADCLRSCAWCDDVHVLDSGSTDRTIEIARAMGATTHYNPFESFGHQRNWAIDNIQTRYDWHFHLDADERFTVPQVQEMFQLLGSSESSKSMAAYHVPSVLILLGRWLKHASAYPAYQVRLFHRGRCRFVDFGHGQRELATGPVGRMNEPYIHFSFANGLVDWFEKHNRYSDLESDQAIQARKARPPFVAALNDDPTLHRRALKDLSYFMPFRGLLRFLYMYFVRAGWLDGKSGFHYCAMMAMYEYWIELKIRERERNWKLGGQSIHRHITEHIRHADVASSDWVKLAETSSNGGPSQASNEIRSWMGSSARPGMLLQPLWRFLQMYIGHFSFLRGREGWHLARLMASREYMARLMYMDKILRARFGHAHIPSKSQDRRLAAKIAPRRS